MGNNNRVFSSGLSMLENQVRGRGDNAMSWVGLATAAVFDSGAVRTELTTDDGAINWKYVAVQAVGAAIVGDRMGEDAGLNYLGNAIGSGYADREYRDLAIYQTGEALGKQAGYKALSAQQQRQIAITGVDQGMDAAQQALREADQYSLASVPWVRLGAGLGMGTAAAPEATASAPAEESAFAQDVARRKALLAQGIDPNAVGGTQGQAEARVRATSATVQEGDRGVENVAKRLTAYFGECDRSFRRIVTGRLRGDFSAVSVT